MRIPHAIACEITALCALYLQTSQPGPSAIHDAIALSLCIALAAAPGLAALSYESRAR